MSPPMNMARRSSTVPPGVDSEESDSTERGGAGGTRSKRKGRRKQRLSPKTGSYSWVRITLTDKEGGQWDGLPFAAHMLQTTHKSPARGKTEEQREKRESKRTVIWFDGDPNCPLVDATAIVHEMTEAEVKWVRAEALRDPDAPLTLEICVKCMSTGIGSALQGKLPMQFRRRSVSLQRGQRGRGESAGAGRARRSASVEVRGESSRGQRIGRSASVQLNTRGTQPLPHTPARVREVTHPLSLPHGVLSLPMLNDFDLPA